ncbi:hypothetical protein Leryth_014797 [Lithospermum erythrorhizon]|nr:hypothetical protein Leryth_014797 [Lithospermum erythrorhizon]
MRRPRHNNVEEVIKKGPWASEEDEVLRNFVKKNGPRDWSSIRTMGLLPRTGKSCRLRWVNKLRPNLKKGCKFTAEEEKLVLDLQEKLGNKWATIATYLSGRTDNDVKNFWSTRQKRLARILKSSTHAGTKKKNNKGKAEVDDEKAHNLLDVKPGNSRQQVKEELEHHSLPELGNTKDVCASTSKEAILDFCLLPEICHGYDQLLEFNESSFMDDFPSQDILEIGDLPDLMINSDDLPFDDLSACNNDLMNNVEGAYGKGKLGSPTNFFDDFPTDMLDYLDGTFGKTSSK